jgi:hypothetical protein
MKKLLILFAFLPILALGQNTTTLNKGGNVQPSDTNTYIATKYELSSAVGIVYPDAGIPLSTGSAWGTSITNSSTNWNTAYTDRLKWDGGATGLTAATGRTSLGGTTVGQALFTLTNPGAITFLRVNADNSITAQSAADFKTSLSLNNVTNESKATMFNFSVFTGATTVNCFKSDIIPETDAKYRIGTYQVAYLDLYMSTGALIHFNDQDVVLTHSSNLLTLSGGSFSIIGGYDLLMTGSIGSTGNRLTKGWFANLEITNYPSVNGTAINSIFAPIANPVFTGLAKLNTDTLSTKAYARSVAGVGVYVALEDSNVWDGGYVTPAALADSMASVSAAGAVMLVDSGVYDGGYVTPTDLDERMAPFEDTVDLATIMPLNSDTIDLVVFARGGGLTADTAQFNDNSIIGSWRHDGSDTLYITKVNAVLAAGTGTETVDIQVSWHATFLSGSATDLFSSAETVTDVEGTGDEFTSFADNVIPPGVRVWCMISGVSSGNRPSYLELTIYGYKVNRAY